jgi:alkylation response protein AidB-like acyl-CoA dehydrogenase
MNSSEETPKTVVPDSRELADFRSRAQTWLAANLTPLARLQDGSYRNIDAEQRTATTTARARAIQRTLFEGGYAGIAYPAEYGGQGLTLEHDRVFREESIGYEMPGRVFYPTLNILGPTLLAFGTESQKQLHIPRMLSGEEIWLQLLSEPKGGSDLAGLVTRADLDGDSYIVNGAKTWSTGAQFADFAVCATRTNWDVPKHHGITALIIPLHAPGIDIRPIRQINGEEEFCEEFLTDVRVPRDNILGEPNGGWLVLRGLLKIEHNAVGRTGGANSYNKDVDDLVAMAQRRGLLADAGIRRDIARLYVHMLAQDLLTVRLSRAMELGLADHALGGVLKLGSNMTLQERTEIAMAIAGPAATAWDPASDDDTWSYNYLTARGFAIAGGTLEIQRNNLGERALHLEKEPSVEKGIAFRNVKRN